MHEKEMLPPYSTLLSSDENFFILFPFFAFLSSLKWKQNNQRKWAWEKEKAKKKMVETSENSNKSIKNSMSNSNKLNIYKENK